MKNYIDIKDIAIIIVILMILAVIYSGSARAQDTTAVKKAEKEVIVLKLKKDADGKSIDIDTTFTISNQEQMNAFREYMKQFNKEMDRYHDDMKSLRLEMDLNGLDDFAFSSDSLADSALQRLIITNRKAIRPHVRIQRSPRSYYYDFDVPCPPEPPLPPDLPAMEWYDKPDKIMRIGPKGNTLDELLGPIPMERVKSYQIKERKGGKRIIIDVDDAPVMPREGKKIIILEEKSKL